MANKNNFWFLWPLWNIWKEKTVFDIDIFIGLTNHSDDLNLQIWWFCANDGYKTDPCMHMQLGNHDDSHAVYDVMCFVAYYFVSIIMLLLLHLLFIHLQAQLIWECVYTSLHQGWICRWKWWTCLAVVCLCVLFTSTGMLAWSSLYSDWLLWTFSLHELLRHEHNGLIFNDHKELAEQLQVCVHYQYCTCILSSVCSTVIISLCPSKLCTCRPNEHSF